MVVNFIIHFPTSNLIHLEQMILLFRMDYQCLCINQYIPDTYEGHLESKERFAIKKYLLIIGKKKNMQVLSHTFTYFST